MHHRRAQSAIEAHFAGALAPHLERPMRDHMGGCAECREHYTRYAELEELLPRALGPQERMRRALGLSSPAPSRGFGWSPAVLAACILLVALPFGVYFGSDDGVVPRGIPISAQIGAFVIEPGRASVRLGDHLTPSAALAFTYVNPEGFSHLLIFAVDAEGDVRWYHPAWTDAAQEPRAVPIQRTHEPVELPAAVRHRDLPRGDLRIFGVFTHEPLDVQTVESHLPPNALTAGEISLDDVSIVSRVVHVR